MAKKRRKATRKEKIAAAKQQPYSEQARDQELDNKVHSVICALVETLNETTSRLGLDDATTCVQIAGGFAGWICANQEDPQDMAMLFGQACMRQTMFNVLHMKAGGAPIRSASEPGPHTAPGDPEFPTGAWTRAPFPVETSNGFMRVQGHVNPPFAVGELIQGEFVIWLHRHKRSLIDLSGVYRTADAAQAAAETLRGLRDDWATVEPEAFAMPAGEAFKELCRETLSSTLESPPSWRYDTAVVQ